jgi:hypothetical protein
MSFTELRECPDCDHRFRIERKSWPDGDTVWCDECDTIPEKVENKSIEGVTWGPDPNP